MKLSVGTKSVLYGAHAFWLHPWFVAIAWWRLYGFPWQPWLWIAFFVHDIGYLGKPNMDGPEGEAHPWLGARILTRLQVLWTFLWGPVVPRRLFPYLTPPGWWQVRRRWGYAQSTVDVSEVSWGREVLFHSRYLAKRYGAQPSRLCVADKLALAITPAWLYLPMVKATGEIREYMDLAHRRATNGEPLSSDEKQATTSGDPRAWYARVQAYMRRWVAEHRDGRADEWTGSQRATRDGVWR